MASKSHEVVQLGEPSPIDKLLLPLVKIIGLAGLGMGGLAALVAIMDAIGVKLRLP